MAGQVDGGATQRTVERGRGIAAGRGSRGGGAVSLSSATDEDGWDVQIAVAQPFGAQLTVVAAGFEAAQVLGPAQVVALRTRSAATPSWP